MWYVYIIKSIRFKYIYIGFTDNINRRIEEHNEGKCKATNPYKPFELISYVALKNKNKAIKLERYLKTGSGSSFLRKRIF